MQLAMQKFIITLGKLTLYYYSYSTSCSVFNQPLLRKEQQLPKSVVDFIQIEMVQRCAASQVCIKYLVSYNRHASVSEMISWYIYLDGPLQRSCRVNILRTVMMYKIMNNLVARCTYPCTDVILFPSSLATVERTSSYSGSSNNELLLQSVCLMLATHFPICNQVIE